MSDLTTVQGVVLSAMPIGEYDKRIVLLTRERGKISAFASGARRPNSPLRAAANALVFGSFELREGRSSNYLQNAAITHQFVELARQQPAIYYAYYFLELADYFGREGTDEREMMNLLYLTVKALLLPQKQERLIRCIYELRTMVIQGYCPELTGCVLCGKALQEESENHPGGEAGETPDTGTAFSWFFSQENHGLLCPDCARHVRDARRISPGARYTMQYIAAVPLGKLFSFRVNEEILRELEAIVHTYVNKNTDRHFKTLDILEVMV